MRPKSKAELTAEIKTLQTRIHNLETGVADQGDTTAVPHLCEQEFRALVEHCPDVIARFDSTLRHSYVNPAIQVMTGLPPQAFIGKTNRELGMPQNLAERWEAALRQVFETGQEVCIEFEYPSPDGPRHYESRLFPEREEDGTIAAAFCIARDVTDRKRVEEALRGAAALFRSFWEHSMDGFLLTHPDGRVLMASPAACRILGRSEEEICRIGRAGVVDSTDPRLSVLLEERARTGKCRGELRFKRPDGTTSLCEITSAVFTGRDGLPWTGMCIRDITECKQAEEKLRESEATARARADELATVLAATPAITFIAQDRDCRRMTSSGAALRLLRLPVDANSSKSAPPGERPETFRAMKDGRELRPEELPVQLAAASGQAVRNFELTLAFDDDTARDIIGHAVPLFNAEGKVCGAVGAFLDITERKRAEEALKQSETLLQKIFDILPVGLWFADKGGKLLRGNPMGVKIWGAEPKVDPSEYGIFKARRLPSGAEIAPDDWALAHTIRDGVTIVDELLEIDAFDGNKKVILNYTAPVLDEQGKLQGAIVVNQDVTERMQMEEALEQNRAELKAIYQHAPVMMCVVDADRRVLYANRLFTEFTGVPESDLQTGHACGVFGCVNALTDPRGCGFGQSCGDCSLRQAIEDTFKIGCGRRDIERRLTIERDGVRRDVILLGATALIRTAGQPTLLLCLQDITERKRAEEALLMHTRQIEAVRAIGEEITRELDLEALLQLITDRSAEMMGGVSGMVALWDEAARLVVPRAWFGLGERLKDLRWRPGEDIPGITDGITHTAALAEPLLFGDRLVGVIRIDREADQQPFTETDRQLLALFANQAAIAIENARLYAGVVRHSEETAALLRASRSLMAGLDLQETLRRIADEAARIARCQHVKVLLRDREKQTLRLGAVVGRLPALLDNFAWTSKESLSAIVASTGQPLFVADCTHDPRNPYADQDRALGLVAYLGLPIRMHGEVVGVLAVNTSQPREYTSEDLEYFASFANLSAIAIENARLFEEVRAGRERLQALSRRQLEVHESERRLLARELHDEIGQLLTGLKLTLDMVAGEASDTGQSLLRESQDLVGELIGHVRELSLNLRPALLDDLGLLPALLWQFERYTTRTQIQVDFQHAGLERRPCPSEVETAAYRIVQEALTNVARHAEASEAQVRLWVEGGTLLMRIEDQGRGFEPTITLDPEESSGLAGMYERAMLLGGHLRIESSPGAGTRIQAELPLGEPGRGG